MTPTEFAKHIDIPRTTLNNYMDDSKPNRVGNALMEAYIELYELRKRDSATKNFLEAYKNSDMTT